MGKKLLTLALFLAFGWAGSAMAQTTTTQVDPISTITISGSPAKLLINAATAGSAPTPVTDNTTSYDITTNESNKKITGLIDLAMPTGVTLKVTFTAPSGATSAGAVALATTAQDLVTGISNVNESALPITYELSATVKAGVIAATSRTVTYTIL